MHDERDRVKKPITLMKTSFRSRDDLGVVLAGMKVGGGLAIRYASERLRDDRELVMAAVSQHHEALKYASERLRDDRELILAAVSHHWNALKYASERLKDDREVVLAAVSQEGEAIRFAGERILSDYQVVLRAISQSYYAFLRLPQRIRDEYPQLRGIVLIKRVWQRRRWPRLVANAVRFHREDQEYQRVLHPNNIKKMVNEAPSLDDFEGPQEPRFWRMIMNIRE